MGAEEAALGLQREVGGGPYACERSENDGTIQLDDVDYYCVEESGQGYWIGTDSDEITGVEPTG